MGFKEDRQKRVEIFEDTMALCKNEKKLAQVIDSSIKNQKIYDGNTLDAEKIFETNPRKNDVQITVSMKRTFEAAEPYAKAGKKVCVLNFASSTRAGGGVETGAGAQEECICRC